MTVCACASREDVSKGQAGGRAGRQTDGQHTTRDKQTRQQWNNQPQK